jgi:hypothetical protein
MGLLNPKLLLNPNPSLEIMKYSNDGFGLNFLLKLF